MGVYWVCQEGSVIESSANLGMHGQGLLKLSGHGDSLRAQRLFVSLFYTVHVSCQLSHECYQYLFFMDVSCLACMSSFKKGKHYDGRSCYV
jgi:hypothetical protein